MTMTAVHFPGVISFPSSQAQRLVQRIQAVFAQTGKVQGLDLFLTTAEESMIPVLQNGEPAPPGETPAVTLPWSDQGEGRIVLRNRSKDPVVTKLAEALLHGVLETLEVEKREDLLLEELGANWESLDALYEISTDVLRSGDIKDALTHLTGRLVSLQDELQVALFISRAGHFEPFVTTDKRVGPLHTGELGPLQKILEDQTVVLMNRMDSALCFPAKHAAWKNAKKLAVSPLSSRQGIQGFVIAWREDGRFEFDSSFSRLLQAITYQTSMLIDSDHLNRKLRESELVAQEIEIASSIQQTLLLATAPKGLPGVEVAAFSAPSQAIDGDFYDFFQHPNGSLDVMIGDVMGKGVAAALLGAATKSQFLRAIANLALKTGQQLPRPVEIVARTSRRLGEQLVALERFVTLCYARFDLPRQLLTYVDCGHTGTILHRKQNDEIQFLRSGNLPLGIFEKYTCEENSYAFLPGDTFLLYSDGVTENRDPEGEFYGEERLVECLQTWSSLGPSSLIEKIRQEAVEFRGSNRFSDDFTCIAVRIPLPSASQHPIREREKTFRCELKELARLRAWLSEETQAMPEGGLGEEALARLHLASTELFTNCVLHATPAPHSPPVTVKSFVFSASITIEIRHAGEAFDPLSVPLPSFDGSRENGFGIYIIARSADELAYTREPDGTNVTTISISRRLKS